MNALPLNGFKYEIPEDVTKSSQRVMNFWVGAMSPLWVPFMAATGFGVGTWMLAKGMGKALAQRSEDFSDMINDNPAMQGLISMEKAIDEAMSVPLQAFVEAETLIADTVMGDYSPPKEAVEAALKAEAEAEIKGEDGGDNAADTINPEPRPIAQDLAVTAQKPKPKARRR